MLSRQELITRHGIADVSTSRSSSSVCHISLDIGSLFGLSENTENTVALCAPICFNLFFVVPEYVIICDSYISD